MKKVVVLLLCFILLGCTKNYYKELGYDSKTVKKIESLKDNNQVFFSEYNENLTNIINNEDFIEDNLESKYYYENDPSKHTRKVSVDENGNGTIDSVSYFQDDENGKCLETKFDFDNDGKIDSTIKHEYDKNGKLIEKKKTPELQEGYVYTKEYLETGESGEIWH